MIKKNLAKKKIWVKKIDPKGSLPQKGHKLAQIGLSCLSGGYTRKSCVQSKFEAEPLKIAPFMIDRTFWDPKLPLSHRPIWGQN